MANQYDKIIKEIMDSVYISLAKKFIDSKFQKTEELGNEFQKTLEKKMDFLRKVIYPNPKDSYILHVEAQSRDDPDMFFRMQEYYALIHSRYKLPIVQVVIYFGTGISKMTNFYSYRKNSFHYELISIQEFSYKTFLASDKPEELILAILADFEEKSKEEVVKMIFSRAKVLLNETNQMGRFVNQIEILSKLRNLEGFIQEFTQNIMALDLKLEDTFTFKQGESKGEKNNRDKMILSLYRKGKLTLEDIADAAEVSVQYVKDLIASPQNETKTVNVEKKDSKKLKK
jgi:hypothetical protein